MDISNVKIDLDKEVIGVWVKVDNTTELLIGSTKSAVYRKAIRESMRKFIEALGDSNVSEEDAERITVETMAKHILLGWRGLTEDGEEIEYSEEKALQFLSDPQLRQLREYVAVKADDISLFRDKTRDEIADNVKK